jgi:hypothetical protein
MFADNVEYGKKYKDVIGLYDVRSSGMRIMSDVISQRVVCFSA